MKYLYKAVLTKGEDVTVLLVRAESFFDAERIFQKEVEKWQGWELFNVHDAIDADRQLEAGEVACIY